MPKASDILVAAAFPSFGLAKLITELVSEKVAATETAGAGGTETLKTEADRQEIELRMVEAQARVAQELAIAGRIEKAEEVEIEEYYEYGADGYAGAKTDGTMLSVGVGGAGKKVTKRIYRFKGFDASIGLTDEARNT